MKIYWSNFPMQIESKRVRRASDRRIRLALKKNFTLELLSEFKSRANSKQNIIMVVFGPQGSGKTFVAVFLIEKFVSYFKPKFLFTIDMTHFSISQFNEAIENTTGRGIQFLDEEIKTSGQGSLIERRQLSNSETTTRQDELSMVFCNPKVAIHSNHYTIETWEMGSLVPWDWETAKKNGTETEEMKKWMFTKSLVYDRDGYPLGYIITGKPKNKKYLEEYNIKKTNFIETVRKQGGSERQVTIRKKMEELKKNEKFVADFLNRTTNASRTRCLRDYLGSFNAGGGEIKEIVGALKDELRSSQKR